MSPLFSSRGGWAAAEGEGEGEGGEGGDGGSGDGGKSGGTRNQGYTEIEREYLSKMYIPGIRKGSNAKALWSFADTMAVFGRGSRSLMRDE